MTIQSNQFLLHESCVGFNTSMKTFVFLYTTQKMKFSIKEYNTMYIILLAKYMTLYCVKSVQIWSYFWSVFSCIQSEYRKIRTRNNSVFGHFSRSACLNSYKMFYVVNVTSFYPLVMSLHRCNAT